jgi:transposase
VIDELAARLAGMEGTVARLARQLLARCRELTAEINALEAELRPLVRQLAPELLAVPGCGVLGAAMILGETAGVSRFRSRMPMPASPAPLRSRCGPVTGAARYA